MKTQKILPGFFVFICLLFLFTACLEYKITTRVHSDGSLERIITVKGDSGEIFSGSLMVPVDSSWDITTSWEDAPDKEWGKKKRYVYSARKVFNNVHQLNAEFAGDSGIFSRITPYVDIHKRFKWFFTYIGYKETYPAYFPFTGIPYSDYLSEYELQVFLDSDRENYIYIPEKDSFLLRENATNIPVLSQADSMKVKKVLENIESRFSSWQGEAIVKEFESIVNKIFEEESQFKNLALDFPAVHDSLVNVISAEEPDYWDAEKLIQLCSKWMGDTLLIKMYTLHVEDFETFNKKLKKEIYPFDQYESEVILPGLLTNSNSDTIQGNTLIWKYSFTDFYIKDFIMQAESRILNSWALVVTGILTVLIFFLIIFRLIKKR
ncbi:MAG: hypothetical protein JXJ22_02975 [Bacteroidales bacterium]|nr:hypothetical protein [Bacteroidales bacterium]